MISKLLRYHPVPLWRRVAEARGSAGAAMLAACVIVVAGLLTFLLAGEKPWSAEIAKRAASGKSYRLDHLITIGTWWGALAAGVLMAGVLALQRWWSVPQPAVFPAAADGVPARRRTVVLLALLAMAVAIPTRVMRLDHSLWNDEEMHLRNYVWGEYGRNAEGGLTFRPVTWREALFYNRKGNNHIGSTIECRLAQAVAGGGWGENSVFRERVLRTPAFVSGILTVGLMVVLGCLLGGPRAGLAAGLLLALHPWHERWSVEMRGYSTMLAGIAGGLICLIRALQTNRWRWWMGFAACQAVFLLCFAGSLYVAIAQNGVAMACILFSGAAREVRRCAAFRLVLAGAWSALPVAVLFGPSVPQVSNYLRQPHDYSPMNVAWFVDLWAHVASGLRPTGDPPGKSLGIAVSDLAAEQPWRGWVIYGVLPVLVAWGLIRLLRQDWRTRLVTGTLALAGLIACLQNATAGTAMMTWYLLYLALLFVLALTWSVEGRSRSPRWRSALLLVAGLFAATVYPALRTIAGIPRQPIREAVLVMRGRSPALADASDYALTASMGSAARQMRSYDPRLQVVDSVDGLRELIARSQDESRPLLFCVRGASTATGPERELLEAVTGDPGWQLISPVLGMEEMLSYEIYSYGGYVPSLRIHSAGPEGE